jgi:hypothetical protein
MTLIPDDPVIVVGSGAGVVGRAVGRAVARWLAEGAPRASFTLVVERVAPDEAA